VATFVVTVEPRFERETVALACLSSAGPTRPELVVLNSADPTRPESVGVAEPRPQAATEPRVSPSSR
jgi:hypothetical protein